MAIRIIFRGLVLFRIVDEGQPHGYIEAQLIDCDEMPGAHHGKGRRASRTALPHAHKHEAEIQISEASARDERPMAMGGGKASRRTKAVATAPFKGIVPTILNAPTRSKGVTSQQDLDISFRGDDSVVKVAESYRKHCPKLAHILNNPPGRVWPHPNKPTRDKNRFIRNVITIHGGTIRVREIVTWDAGEYQLVDSPETGRRVTTPAEVNFLTSDVHGHVASECVVEVESDYAEIAGLNGSSIVEVNASGAGSTRVPPGTADILFTNLPPQREVPAPWSLHFFCLFLAAGYQPGDLSGRELDWFKRFARRYNNGTNTKNAFQEDEDFLGSNGTTGFPFPYLRPETALTRLKPIRPPLTDPWNRPLCPQGDE